MSVTDAEKAFYESVLADPDSHSIQDLRYAFFLAGASGGVPVVDSSTLQDGYVPVWDADEGKWVPGPGGGGGGGAVDSVNGKTGAVVLGAADVGARADTWTPAVGDIPSLPASKTTSGTFDAARIPSLPISKTTGLQTALDSKIGSGNASVTGVEYYPSVADLPATGTAGVIYVVPAA